MWTASNQQEGWLKHSVKDRPPFIPYLRDIVGGYELKGTGKVRECGGKAWRSYNIKRGTGQLKCDGTRTETGFLLSLKRTSPFKLAWVQFSRILAAEVCASAVVMLDTPCSEVV